MACAKAISSAIIGIIVIQQLIFIGADVGVNYGLLGDNLPTPVDVVNLLKSKNIPIVRIFDPNPDVLEALKGSNIGVSMGVKNEDLANLASNPQAGTDWVNTNIIPYRDQVNFQYITAGNEVLPGDLGQFVLPTIKNLQSSLGAAGLGGIKVTTVVATTALGTSYPPSQGAFSEEASTLMTDLVGYLHSQGYPLMVNVYPYFALASNPGDISLDYALFQLQNPLFTDDNLPYYNLFDAMFDAFVAAIEKALGTRDLELILSETGWPSARDTYATVDNAEKYNNNLKNHVGQGSPRYGRPIQAYIFALFNEDQKPGGVEQNFGNFFPDMTPVYPLWG